LNVWLATLVLSLTVCASVGLGVLAASWVVSGVLYALGDRAQSPAAPVLRTSETHALGD